MFLTVSYASVESAVPPLSGDTSFNMMSSSCIVSWDCGVTAAEDCAVNISWSSSDRRYRDAGSGREKNAGNFTLQ